MGFDRQTWHPKTRAALAEMSDQEIAALDREELLVISGVGPKSVDAVLASIAASRQRAPEGESPPSRSTPSGAAPEHPWLRPGLGEYSPPLGPPASSASQPNGHRFCHFPAAANLFPAILEASGGNASYASEAAASTAATMGAWESEVARAALDMLREFYRAGNIPRPQDARECVRLVRHLFDEVCSPTPSPFDSPTGPDEWPAEEI